MTRPFHRLKHRAIRAGQTAAHHARRAFRGAAWFVSPVAESVRGELCREEWKRVAVKFTGTYLAGVSYKVIVKDPSFYGDLVAPLVPAAVIGIGDAIRRLGHGTDPIPPGTPPDGPLPPAVQP